MSESTFWLVWSPTGARPPLFRHASLVEATVEAKRLARENRAAEFYVLQAVQVARLVDVQVSELKPADTDDDDMPF